MAQEMVPWGTGCKNRLEPRPGVLQTAVTLNKQIVGLAALYHTEHNFGPSSVWNPQQLICSWLGSPGATESRHSFTWATWNMKKEFKFLLDTRLWLHSWTSGALTPLHRGADYLASLSCLATVRISLAPLLSSKLARSSPSRSALSWASAEILLAVTPTRWTRSSTSSWLCHTHHQGEV